MPRAIPANGEAMASEEILSKYRDLEGAICNAHCMAVCLDDLLELKFHRAAGGRWVVDLSQENVDALAFAWKELRNLTGSVVGSFYAVEEDRSNG